MALVKTSKLANGGGSKAARPTPGAAQPRGRAKAEPLGADRLSERIAAATEELAAGLTEASAAAEELQRAMSQIAAGADAPRRGRCAN